MTNKMSQEVKPLADKLDNLSSISRIHMVEEENQFL